MKKITKFKKIDKLYFDIINRIGLERMEYKLEFKIFSDIRIPIIFSLSEVIEERIREDLKNEKFKK